MTMTKKICYTLCEKTAICPLKTFYVTKCKHHLECDIKRNYKCNRKTPIPVITVCYAKECLNIDRLDSICMVNHEFTRNGCKQFKVDMPYLNSQLKHHILEDDGNAISK